MLSILENLSMGEQAILRRFSPYLSEKPSSTAGDPTQWSLLPYRLLDGTEGELLLAEGYRESPVFDGSNLPPILEIPLPKEGVFTIKVGIPLFNRPPILTGVGAAYGIDLAVGAETFTNVSLEYGVRYGKILEEENREFFCDFKDIVCDGSPLRIRVPFGAYRSLPHGFLRGICSSLSFTRQEAPRIFSTPDSKPLIVVGDGFTHYFDFANHGECIDARLPEIYQNTDIKIIMAQTHGSATWPSAITSSFGEGMTNATWEDKRSGDRRIGEYTQWAISAKQEGLRVQGELCRKYGIQFHYSLRANLFMTSAEKDQGRFMNGRWWMEHPAARLPKSNKLDYAKKEVRDYALALMEEALREYRVDGINLDLTRWPPVFSPIWHDDNVCLTMIKEMRVLADTVGREQNRKIQVSLSFVHRLHSKYSLEEQKINPEILLQAGVLDFICVQAHDISSICQIAKKHNTLCFGIQDGESIYHEGGWRVDPLWRLPNGEIQDDSAAGEEWKKQPDLRCCLAPWEYQQSLHRMYSEGADGISIVNNFMGNRTIRTSGNVETVAQRAKIKEVYGQTKGDYIFLLKENPNEVSN